MAGAGGLTVGAGRLPAGGGGLIRRGPCSTGSVKRVPFLQHRRAAGGPGERAAPEGGLDQVAAHAHPLRLRPRRDQRVVEAGGDLDHGARHPLGQAGDEVPGGRVGVRVEDPPAGARPAPRRVAEDRVDAGHVERRGVAALHGEPVGQPGGLGVRGGHRGGHRVGLHPVHADSGAGGGERVGAEAAAQVGQRAHPGGAQPLGPPVGHHPPGGLFQPRAGEEHAGGGGAELADRPAAQLGLGQRGGGQPGGQPGGAERRRRRQRVAAGHPGRRGERGRPLGGTQCGELVEIHPVIVPARSGAARAASACDTAGGALALSLTEC